MMRDMVVVKMVTLKDQFVSGHYRCKYYITSLLLTIIYLLQHKQFLFISTATQTMPPYMFSAISGRKYDFTTPRDTRVGNNNVSSVGADGEGDGIFFCVCLFQQQK